MKGKLIRPYCGDYDECYNGIVGHPDPYCELLSISIYKCPSFIDYKCEDLLYICYDRLLILLGAHFVYSSYFISKCVKSYPIYEHHHHLHSLNVSVSFHPYHSRKIS